MAKKKPSKPPRKVAKKPVKAAKAPKGPVKKKLPDKKTAKPKNPVGGFASNNFNAIRALIWREYGLDYGSYFNPELLRISKLVYQKCKQFSIDEGRGCSDKDILRIFDDILDQEKEGGRQPYPDIEENLFNPMPYYELTTVKFETFPSYLYIYSPMIMPPPSIFNVTQYYDKDGDMSKGYKKYFREFITWCNHETQIRAGGSEVDTEDIEIFVKFLKPEYNEEDKQWEAEIVICTASGEKFSFGFVPKGNFNEHDEEEFIEAPVLPLPDVPLTPEQIQVRKKNNAKLFSSLLKLTRKYEQLEKLQQAKAMKPKKQAPTAKQVRDTQKGKERELARLKDIKKELQSAVSLYKRIGDKKRMKKSLQDLDAVMNKIRKLA